MDAAYSRLDPAQCVELEAAVAGIGGASSAPSAARLW